MDSTLNTTAHIRRAEKTSGPKKTMFTKPSRSHYRDPWIKISKLLGRSSSRGYCVRKAEIRTAPRRHKCYMVVITCMWSLIQEFWTISSVIYTPLRYLATFERNPWRLNSWPLTWESTRFTSWTYSLLGSKTLTAQFTVLKSKLLLIVIELACC